LTYKWEKLGWSNGAPMEMLPNVSQHVMKMFPRAATASAAVASAGCNWMFVVPR